MGPLEILVHVQVTVDSATGRVSMREEITLGTYGPVWQFANVEIAHSWLAAYGFRAERGDMPGAHGLYSDYYGVAVIAVL